MHHKSSSSSSNMHNTQGQIELMDKLRVHADQYASQSKANYMAMLDVWSDLEVDDDQQRQELEETMAKALGCWTSAVAELRARQQAVRDSIQQSLSSIMRIKEELGADNPAADADLQRLQGNRSAHRTLRAWELDVLSKASYWEQCRRQRMTDFEDLQARIKLLRHLCGLPPLPPPIEKPDISKSNMEFLKLELERLATEKERREDLLRKLLDDLHVLCCDLGEDMKQAVTEVHPNLTCLWDADAARVLRDVYRLGSSYSSTTSGMVDLGDSTISRLGSKLTIMRDLKASRGAHATEVLSVLNSLWDATDVPDQERAHFVRMMSGPLRLHAASLEKCMSEVRRLEDVRYQQMVDLVLSKGAELSAMCLDSHVEQPAGLQQALDAIHGNDRNPGAAAELLAKLLHMLAEVQVLTSKRATIIAVIKELEAARHEDVWLAQYETDDQRYKGRDANKKLQRAIRAGKLRDRLPAMVEELRALLAEWRDCEGEAFLYDGRDYEFEVLDALAAAVEDAAASRAAKAARSASSRRQSLAPSGSPGGSSTAGGIGAAPGSNNSGSRLMGPTPRKSMATSSFSSGSGSSSARGGAAAAAAGIPRPMSATGCAASSPAPRRVGGPSTPMPLRGVSNCSLRERHSICVVRDREPVSGPSSLSRSGEVRLRPDHHNTGRHTTSSSSAAGGASLSRRSSMDNNSSPSVKSAAAMSLCRSSGEGLGSRSSPGKSPSKSPSKSPAAAAAAVESGSSFKTPPPNPSRRFSRDAPPSSSSSTPERQHTNSSNTNDGSCKRVSTSSKLHNIFSRSSVQHPVATLAAEPSGSSNSSGMMMTDSATTADQDAY